MLLDDPARGWVALRAIDVRPGDCLIRDNCRGPVVRSVSLWGGWVHLTCDPPAQLDPLRQTTGVVVERWLLPDEMQLVA
jgi:hypothetical protein